MGRAQLFSVVFTRLQLRTPERRTASQRMSPVQRVVLHGSRLGGVCHRFQLHICASSRVVFDALVCAVPVVGFQLDLAAPAHRAQVADRTGSASAAPPGWLAASTRKNAKNYHHLLAKPRRSRAWPSNHQLCP